MIPDRGLGVAAGLAGAAGVIMAALAAHGGAAGGHLDTAARFLLLHAPALLALALFPPPRRRAARLAGGLLIAGLLLFCGDLALRTAIGHALFPYAAPLGGMLLILGWVAVAGAALSGGDPQG